MANNTKSNSSTTIVDFVNRVCDRIVKSVLRFFKEDVAEKELKQLLKESSGRIMMYLSFSSVFSILCLLPIHWVSTIAHIRWIVCFFSYYSLAKEIALYFAICKSREARIAFEKKEQALDKKLARGIAIITIVSIVITQNLWGIGDAIVGALPWVLSPAKAVLGFINGTVADLTSFFMM